ncbi:MAG: hypothetical protein HG453_000360 [Clostridiales bacterium]|jgi:hypothetical protein|nr:hypothetical protein [Clostridiales bacterium]MBB1552633.1 hypothetical protein [Clostridiales bacterium]MBF0926723.1 hypothetical protein [Clostridiales bacterium]
MRLPLLDYTEPFNASATLLLVALLLWVGLKEKKNTLPMVVVICSMLILAVQTVELMLNINNVELMVLLVKNIIIGQVYMYLGFAVLLIVDHKNKQLRTDKLEDEIADIRKELAKKAKVTKTTKTKKEE